MHIVRRTLAAWVLGGLPLTAAGPVSALAPPAGAGAQAAGDASVFLPRPGLQVLESPLAQTTPPDLGLDAAAAGAGTHSVYRAAILSALVPGLGEYYTGHTKRALVSGTVEAGIWTAYITFKVQEDMRGERSIEYATYYAGAATGGDEDYYKAVGQFLRAEGPGMWNEFVRRRERDTGEVVGREYVGSEAWAWTSTDRFVDYRQLRKDQLTAGDHATNALAFAIVNRILSVASVVQAVRSDHARSERALGLRLEVQPVPGAEECRLGLARRF